ncbi:hypothetical protein HDU87_008421 [Geranomyces variabilis]|uniref:Uncharacterized protein n=1 Tax=Geranomyces variabilis TaxID=109894 RepID=A0AAD5XP82_9FUNG|nr:hypothetical protein HDU87_008421 [Geranomyces variabilis]
MQSSSSPSPRLSSPKPSPSSPVLLKAKHPHPPCVPRTRNPRHDDPAAATTAALKTSDLDSTTSHDNNNNDAETSDLTRLINAYAEMDLNRDTDAFYAWVGRKSHHNQGSKPHKKTPKTNTMKRPSSPPPSSLSSLQRGKAKPDSEAAFRAWLASKHRAASIRKQTLLAISTPTPPPNTITTTTSSLSSDSTQKQKQKQARTQLEIKLWHRGKRVRAQRALLDEAKRERIREWEGRQKRHAAKIAFEKWVERKDCEKGKAWAVVHPKKWVTDADNDEDDNDNCPPPRRGATISSARGSETRSLINSKVQTPASPPNVFTDYPRCATLTPEYVHRYRVLVASAGAAQPSPTKPNRPTAAASRHDWQTPPVLTKRGGPWIAAGGYGHVDKAEKKVARAEVA